MTLKLTQIAIMIPMTSAVSEKSFSALCSAPSMGRTGWTPWLCCRISGSSFFNAMVIYLFCVPEKSLMWASLKTRWVPAYRSLSLSQHVSFSSHVCISLFYMTVIFAFYVVLFGIWCLSQNGCVKNRCSISGCHIYMSKQYTVSYLKMI